MSVRVKICGLTRAADAEVAARGGAWAVGVVLSPVGPRALALEEAAEVLAPVTPEVERVGVFVSPSADDIRAALAALPLSRVQVHGALDPRAAAALSVPMIRAREFATADDLAGIRPRENETVLLDSRGPDGAGGTGRTLNWSILQECPPGWPFVLAGGLRADNVEEAVDRTRPYAVDVSSGVESAPGRKDHDEVLRFIANASRGLG